MRGTGEAESDVGGEYQAGDETQGLPDELSGRIDCLALAANEGDRAKGANGADHGDDEELLSAHSIT
ncbi:hypothetical protein MAFF212519_30380 [Clavibacter michiganensis]